jgi:hypothetical protein
MKFLICGKKGVIGARVTLLFYNRVFLVDSAGLRRCDGVFFGGLRLVY